MKSLRQNEGKIPKRGQGISVPSHSKSPLKKNVFHVQLLMFPGVGFSAAGPLLANASTHRNLSLL